MPIEVYAIKYWANMIWQILLIDKSKKWGLWGFLGLMQILFIDLSLIARGEPHLRIFFNFDY